MLNRVLFCFLLLSFSFCHPLQDRFELDVKNEFLTQPFATKVITESDLKPLPNPVQQYLRYTGVVGKPRTTNFRLAFEELMYKSPKADAMVSSSEQYNFYSKPARHFYMRADMMGIPFRVYHSYSNEKATMEVKIANLFDVVNLKGEELTKAETVTVLNDLCLFAPSALLQKNVTWETIDEQKSRVWYENGSYKVSAILFFNEVGELTNFISEDRSALQDDGSLRKARWSTPVNKYKEFQGIKVPTYGEAIWHYPEGDFVYGKFYLKEIERNLESFPSQ